MSVRNATAPIGTEIVRGIPLTQGKVAIVDADDYEWLSQYKWSAFRGRYTFYAQRCARINGKKRIILMHRQILGLFFGDKHVSDHINHNGIDNRRSNLRLASRVLNGYNCKIHKDNKSGFRGVCWVKRTQAWQAQIRVNGQTIWCGSYPTAIAAAVAYDSAAIKYRGDTAILNFSRG